MEEFNLKTDRADVIVPAAEIFLIIAGIVKAEYIHVPVIGLTDGIIDNLYAIYLKTEKKGLFTLWENRRKKEKQERENYSRNLQLTMSGYAVAEETVYEEDDMGKTVYMEEQPETRETRHRLMTEEGKLLVSLEQDTYTIGKKRGEADLVLEEPSVSRLHARIVKETDGYYLEDMNSTNGTLKNGLRLQPYEKRKLEEGDEITFGKRILIYR